MTRGSTTKSRCLVVWAAITALCLLLGATCLGTAVQAGARAVQAGGTPGSFEDVLVAAGGALGTVCLARLWLVATWTALEAARGRATWSSRRSPVRRLVLVLCGVALTGALAAPGHAAPDSAAGRLAGLPYPDRATTGSVTTGAGTAAPDTARPAPPAPPAQPAQPVQPVQTARPTRPAQPASAPSSALKHRVAPGDTLWSIATGTLGPGSADAAIDARWREIHRLNVALVGDDPDLIHPGQELLLPAPDEGDRS